MSVENTLNISIEGYLSVRLAVLGARSCPFLRLAVPGEAPNAPVPPPPLLGMRYAHKSSRVYPKLLGRNTFHCAAPIRSRDLS